MVFMHSADSNESGSEDGGEKDKYGWIQENVIGTLSKWKFYFLILKIDS